MSSFCTILVSRAYLGGDDHFSVDWMLTHLTTRSVTLQFEPKQTQGRTPSSRGYHVTTLADSRLWVFGGFDGRVVSDDVWLLDLAAAAYLPQVRYLLNLFTSI